jgi:hypothetical protein
MRLQHLQQHIPILRSIACASQAAPRRLLGAYLGVYGKGTCCAKIADKCMLDVSAYHWSPLSQLSMQATTRLSIATDLGSYRCRVLIVWDQNQKGDLLPE